METETADAIGELSCGAGWVTAGEMVGTEILVPGAVGQHVVGGGENRGRHGNRSFLGATACLEPQELSLKVTVLLRPAAQAL